MQPGVSVDYTLAAAKAARKVIAQVNRFMPRTHGNSFLHVSEIDCFVEHDQPIIELPPATTSDVEQAIGAHCAALVEDGSTLQLGIGSLPDAVLSCLKDKKDIGIHSEMISDGVVSLVEAGVINCQRKTLHNGKIVVSFLMGTRKLYDFVDDNPMMHMAPVDYVNDPYVIRQNTRNGLHQLLRSGGPDGPGLLREHRPQADQRGRRAGGLRARR